MSRVKRSCAEHETVTQFVIPCPKCLGPKGFLNLNTALKLIFKRHGIRRGNEDITGSEQRPVVDCGNGNIHSGSIIVL